MKLQRLTTTSLLFISALLFVSLLLILFNCTPPVSRDALTHHLALPKLYLLYGTIYEIPDLLFSYYPMNLELLYLVPLYFGLDTLPKIIHLSFGIGTSYLIFRYLNSYLNQVWGLFGALFFLTTPIIVHLSTSAYVDLGITFFTTASIMSLLQWQRTNRLWFLALAGICAGLAAGTKYNGLISVFLLSCFIPFLRNDENNDDTQPLKAWMVFCFCAFLAVSPWLIRNIIWTGNPVFPLFQSLFNPDQTNNLLQGMNPFITRKIAYNEPLLQTMLIPIRIFFEGQDNNPRFFDGVLNPFILIFSLFALLPDRGKSLPRKDLKLFIWFVVLFITFTFIQRVIRIRYIVPALPVLIILSTYGLYNVQRILAQKNFVRLSIWIPALLLTTSLLFNTSYLWNHWNRMNVINYLNGKVDRNSYIAHYWPEYPLIEFSNNNLPESSHTLAIFLGNRGYYFDRRVTFDLRYGKSLLCSLVRQNKTVKDIFLALQDLGISHVLVRLDLFEYWYQKNLTDKEVERLELFIKTYSRLIAKSENHQLLEIHDSESQQH